MSAPWSSSCEHSEFVWIGMHFLAADLRLNWIVVVDKSDTSRKLQVQN